MAKFIYFKNEEEFEVWINPNNIATLVMKECGAANPHKVTIAWTAPGGASESCKVHKNTADKIKIALNCMTTS
jgi:hypothetical protein